MQTAVAKVVTSLSSTWWYPCLLVMSTYQAAHEQGCQLEQCQVRRSPQRGPALMEGMLAGVSADRHGKGGALVMLDARDLTFVRTISMPGSVLGMHWDAQLNQIFVAAGESLLPPAQLPVLPCPQAVHLDCCASVRSGREKPSLRCRAWEAPVLHFLCTSLSDSCSG